jgi:hypothetical protein
LQTGQIGGLNAGQIVGKMLSAKCSRKVCSICFSHAGLLSP